MKQTPISWKLVLNSLQKSQELEKEQALWAMDQMMTGQTPDSILGAFLMGLHTKGESSQELEYLSQGMLAKAVRPSIRQQAVDIVGTGGDQQNTVNISTMAAVVIAASGVPVVKHGNRASSSASGSADVLEALGVPLDLSIEEVEQCSAEIGIAFLFAQVFHPSMRFVAPVRRQMGVPSVFNFLGPLTNPAQVLSSAIGVAREDFAEKIAGVFAQRKNHHALVFRGHDGLDELTVSGPSDIWEIHQGEIRHQIFDPREFGFVYHSLSELRGADASYNAQIFSDVMSQEICEGAIYDAVVLNATAGLMAYQTPEELTSFEERFDNALNTVRETLSSGKAQAKLESWINFKS
ncbi:anthranilate phosphoribosyltransferase [Rothia sp. P7181]|uniref:anthranilate phosphoribosyltransferase n=1 Tax=Rothia sp. P7181 TaxID=3402663 RepID=UPI003AE00851